MAIKYYNYKVAAGVSRIAMFNKLLTQGMITTVFSPREKAYNLDRLNTFLMIQIFHPTNNENTDWSDTNTNYRTVTKTLYARLQYSRCKIRVVTNTKSDKVDEHFAPICLQR